MNSIGIERDYEKAIHEIKRAYYFYEKEMDYNKSNQYPYFFIVGAGVSAQVVKTSGEIIDECKKICSNEAIINEGTKYDQYSYWFQKAFPHKETRRMYLENLIKDAKIPEEAAKLANILQSRKVSNLVVTPNFDKFIYEALNIFCEKNILVGERPESVSKLNIDSNFINILHVHGTYEFYDCCNLSTEIIERASEEGFFSVKYFLRNILSKMSPIIIGYSGWENDVIMKQLKERLEMPLKYKIYWFCYNENDYNNIPNWVKYEDEDKKKKRDDIIFVLPKEKKDQNDNIDIKDKMEVIEESTLGASEIFSSIIQEFQINLPHIIENPIEFLKMHYAESLSSNTYNELLLLGLNAKSDSNKLISEIKRNIILKDTKMLLINTTEVLRNIEDYDDEKIREILACLIIVINEYKVNRIEKSELNEIILMYSHLYTKLKDINDKDKGNNCIVRIQRVLITDDNDVDKNEIDNLYKVMSEVYNSNKYIDEYYNWLYKIIVLKLKYSVKDEKLYSDIINKIKNIKDKKYEILSVFVRMNRIILLIEDNEKFEFIDNEYREILNVSYQSNYEEIKEVLPKVMMTIAIYAEKLNEYDRAIKVYDSLINKYEKYEEMEIKEDVVMAKFNKAECLRNLNRFEEAAEVYDELIYKYCENKVLRTEETVVIAYLNEALCLRKLERHEDAIETFNKLINNYGEEEEIKIKERVVMGYEGKGVYLGELKEYEKAIEVYDELIDRYFKEESHKIKKVVFRAYNSKCVCLGMLEKHEDAIEIYNSLLNKYGKEDEDVEIKELMAKIYGEKANYLCRLDKYEEAIQVYDELINKYRDEERIEIKELVVEAYINKGFYLSKLGRYEIAADMFYLLIDKYRKEDNEKMRQSVMTSEINIAYMLRRNKIKNEKQLDIKELLKNGLEEKNEVALINNALILINEEKYKESLSNINDIVNSKAFDWWIELDDDIEKYIVIYLGLIMNKILHYTQSLQEIVEKLKSVGLEDLVEKINVEINITENGNTMEEVASAK